MKKIAFVIAILLWGSTSIAVEPVVSTTVTAAWTTICEDAFGRYGNLSFGLKNTGATNPLTDCRVQIYVGPTTADWIDYAPGWAACAVLAAGGMTTWEMAGNSFQKIRVQAKSAAGTTTHCRQNAN